MAIFSFLISRYFRGTISLTDLSLYFFI